MSPSTKLDDKLEGIENFCSWKYIIGLIIEENDHAKLIKEVVLDLEEDEAKEKHNKDMISVTEKTSYGLGYHNRQGNRRNQSFPICKRNQTSNTKGY